MSRGYPSNGVGVGQVKHWDSLSEYLAQESKLEPLGKSESNSWYDYVSHEQAVERATHGDDSLVAKAHDIVERIGTIAADVPKYGWTRGVQGPRVDIPAYLAGSPACFKRRVKRARDVRHVRIVVATACSAGIPASVMLQRGLYILGLVDALQAAQVNVELWVEFDVVASGGPHEGKLIVHTVKLDDPINLSVQGFCLAHPAFARHIMYTMGWHLGQTSRSLGCCALAEEVRPAIGLNDEDVFIPGVYLDDELCTNPEQWLKERITQLVGGEA